MLRSHAARAVSGINEAVECLGREDGAVDLEFFWNKIGETHNKRKISQQAFLVRFYNLLK